MPDVTGAAVTAEKTLQDSRHALELPAFPEKVNEYGFVKAGHILKLIDITGAITTMKHIGLGKLVVTASLDRMNFIHPVRCWEMIHLESRMTQVWHSSLEVQVKVSSWNFRTGTRRSVAEAYLVFVVLDKDRRKVVAPPLVKMTAEDMLLAQAADLRKEIRSREGRELPFWPIEPNESPVIVEQLMTPIEANADNNVFGGVILSLIDEAATGAAQRQALVGTVAGVHLDRMSFLGPAFIGETVRARAIVNRVWRTSMEIQVEVDALNPNSSTPRSVAKSYLVYVKLNAEGNPSELPPYEPQTELQKMRAEAADRRRELRRQEEQEVKNLSVAPDVADNG